MRCNKIQLFSDLEMYTLQQNCYMQAPKFADLFPRGRKCGGTAELGSQKILWEFGVTGCNCI